jgi:hypothetical protein
MLSLVHGRAWSGRQPDTANDLRAAARPAQTLRLVSVPFAHAVGADLSPSRNVYEETLLDPHVGSRDARSRLRVKPESASEATAHGSGAIVELLDADEGRADRDN